MANWRSIYPSRFLEGALLEGREVEVTIKRIFTEELEDSKKKMVSKIIAEFVESPKQMILQKTNLLLIESALGTGDVAEWPGKKLYLGTEMVRNPETGENGPAVRVKGSPSIQGIRHFKLKLPRKKVQDVTLHGPKQAQPVSDKTQPVAEKDSAK